MRDEIGDDEPIPLAKAAEIFFRSHLTKSALRTEARKGNLEILRIANKDFVTRRAIQKMIARCTVKVGPTLTHGEAEHTAVAPSAQEALRIRLQKRIKGA